MNFVYRWKCSSRLICFFTLSFCASQLPNASWAWVKKDKKIEQTKAAETKAAETEVDDELTGAMKQRAIAAIRRSAMSDRDAVAIKAFEILASEPRYHQELGEGVQFELVKRGAESSELQGNALQILESSQISGIERQDLFLKFYRSQNSRVSKQSLIEIDEQWDKYLSRFIDQMKNNPLGDHALALSLIERWGPEAKDSLPHLLNIYQKRKKLAEETNRPVEFMDLLIAVGEMGPEGKPGLSLILDACEMKGNDEQSTTYVVAGFACFQKVTGQQQPKPGKGRYEEYLKYTESLIKKYDKDRDSKLSKAEVENMRRPLTGADQNKDGFLTKTEIARAILGTGRPAYRSTIRSDLGLEKDGTSRSRRSRSSEKSPQRSPRRSFEHVYPASGSPPR